MMKPLTLKDLKNEFKSAFKTNNQVLMKGVRSEIKSAIQENNEVLVKRIDDVVYARLSEFSDVVIETIDTNRDEANQKFDLVIKKIDDLSTDVKFMHQNLKDIVTDMSDKPSKRQFEDFKSSFKNYPTV